MPFSFNENIKPSMKLKLNELYEIKKQQMKMKYQMEYMEKKLEAGFTKALQPIHQRPAKHRKQQTNVEMELALAIEGEHFPMLIADKSEESPEKQLVEEA